tara:strand:- start:58672 stop:60303 length:1632 start_codon:yes stop_codon:yes gene_type:complete
MRKHKWEITVVAVLCTITGLITGGFVAGTDAKKPADEAGAASHGPHLPAATIKNLGIRVEKIHPSTFFRTASVAAVVVDTPATEQPVFAPIGGRIESIEVEPGTVVSPGKTVVTLVRDPLPRPTLTLTADILRPAQERLHENVLLLRKSAEDERIASTELERVEKFTGNVGGRDLPILPRQRAIDLRYQLSRAKKEHEQARLELQKHGLSEPQITAVAGGASVPEFTEETWQRALARNGLWPEAAQKLNAALPTSLRALPWATATVGELSARGLATEELTEWVKSEEVARHFLDIGVLLQRGHTLASVKRLHRLNALEPVVRVEAPLCSENGAWDVLAVRVKRGATVSEGQELIVLRDPRRLLLRTEPVGGEVASVLAAVAGKDGIVAKPLVIGSGPMLEGLSISYIESSPENEGTLAFVEVENTPSSEIDRGRGRMSRTWKLREGLRYLLSVPTQKMENVYVLPSAAVTEDGPSKIVFIQDGDSFKAVPIVIAYQDHEVVVVPASKEVALFPGDPVVLSGAFELGLAMKGGDAPDAHAGHNH